MHCNRPSEAARPKARGKKDSLHKAKSGKTSLLPLPVHHDRKRLLLRRPPYAAQSDAVDTGLPRPRAPAYRTRGAGRRRWQGPCLDSSSASGDHIPAARRGRNWLRRWARTPHMKKPPAMGRGLSGKTAGSPSSRTSRRQLSCLSLRLSRRRIPPARFRCSRRCHISRIFRR